jgi:hypothetical protein
MERDHFEDQGVDGRIGSEWILGRIAMGVQSGYIWLRTETGGGLVVNTLMNLRSLAPRS